MGGDGDCQRGWREGGGGGGRGRWRGWVMGSEGEAGKMFGEIPVLAPCVVVFHSPVVSFALLRLLISLYQSHPPAKPLRKEEGGQVGIKAKKKTHHSNRYPSD